MSTNRADIDMDLIANVDRIRHAYMVFARLPDDHGALVMEHAAYGDREATVLWHLAEATRKALTEILGDETLALVLYDAMGDSGESARYHLDEYWMYLLRKAAEIKQWNRNKAKRGY